MDIKSNPEWDEKSSYEKRLSIIGIVLSFMILILTVLSITGIFQNSIIICAPLLGLLMFIQAMQMWKTRRAVAVCCIIVAVILFLCSIFLAFVHR